MLYDCILKGIKLPKIHKNLNTYVTRNGFKILETKMDKIERRNRQIHNYYKIFKYLSLNNL